MRLLVFYIFTAMRILTALSLFLALSVILAHSVFPHHHHKVKTEKAKHSEEHQHSHDKSNGHQHNDDSDSHHHGLFTYSQIDNIFLTGKQVIVPITLTPIIEIFEWSFIAYNTQGPDNSYRKDIELPPLICCQEISFRGPPII